jgi:hypothetical protein
VSKLTGVERDAYLACDAVTDAGQLPADHAAALGSLVARRLMLADGVRHLSLAVPIGDYRPPVAAAARLRPLIAQVDAADRRAVTRAFRAV